jgi:hypothetical protein
MFRRVECRARSLAKLRHLRLQHHLLQLRSGTGNKKEQQFWHGYLSRPIATSSQAPQALLKINFVHNCDQQSPYARCHRSGARWRTQGGRGGGSLSQAPK